MGEKSYNHYGMVAIVIILAAVLRIYGLERTSFWYDEAFSWHLVSLPFLEMYQETLKDTHPPLFNLLAWTWVQIFGDSEFALRLLSALFGTATVYFLPASSHSCRNCSHPATGPAPSSAPASR